MSSLDQTDKSVCVTFQISPTRPGGAGKSAFKGDELACFEGPHLGLTHTQSLGIC